MNIKPRPPLSPEKRLRYKRRAMAAYLLDEESTGWPDHHLSTYIRAVAGQRLQPSAEGIDWVLVQDAASKTLAVYRVKLKPTEKLIRVPPTEWPAWAEG